MDDKEFQDKIKKCFIPVDKMVNDLYDGQFLKEPTNTKRRMEVISSYVELNEIKQHYGLLQIIPEKPIDYHPYLKKGCLGFKDRTKRCYIFRVDKVDYHNIALECHVVGIYDIEKKERFGYRCGNSVKCTWYLNAGEKYLYNVTELPDDKYNEFVFATVVLASKDVDQIRDNGGKSEYKDLSRPGRDDKRNRYNVKEINKEDRADYKDTVFDPDLKTGKDNTENMNIRMAKELHKAAKMLLARDLGRVWNDEQKHIEMVAQGKFNSYLRDFLDYVQSHRKEYYEKAFDADFYARWCKPLTYKTSSAYVKIICEDNGSKSVWGFVNVKNGDILKAATWNSPAKHARGNIFDKSSWKNSCSAYGPTYLR